jgi:hypothetical protein
MSKNETAHADDMPYSKLRVAASDTSCCYVTARSEQRGRSGKDCNHGSHGHKHGERSQSYVKATERENRSADTTRSYGRPCCSNAINPAIVFAFGGGAPSDIGIIPGGGGPKPKGGAPGRPGPC